MGKKRSVVIAGVDVQGPSGEPAGSVAELGEGRILSGTLREGGGLPDKTCRVRVDLVLSCVPLSALTAAPCRQDQEAGHAYEVPFLHIRA